MRSQIHQFISASIQSNPELLACLACYSLQLDISHSHSITPIASKTHTGGFSGDVCVWGDGDMEQFGAQSIR